MSLVELAAVPTQTTWLCDKYFADLYLEFNGAEQIHCIALSLHTVYKTTNLVSIMQINVDEVNTNFTAARFIMPSRVTYRGCLEVLNALINKTAVCRHIGYDIVIAADYLGVNTDNFKCIDDDHEDKITVGDFPTKEEMLNHKKLMFELARVGETGVETPLIFNVLIMTFSYDELFTFDLKNKVIDYLLAKGRNPYVSKTWHTNKWLAEHLMPLDIHGKVFEKLGNNANAETLALLANSKPADIYFGMVESRIIAYKERDGALRIHNPGIKLGECYRVFDGRGSRDTDQGISYNKCPLVVCNCKVIDGRHRPQDTKETAASLPHENTRGRVEYWYNGKKYTNRYDIYNTDQYAKRSSRVMVQNVDGEIRCLVTKDLFRNYLR